MRDDQQAMIILGKIIEKYPNLYNGIGTRIDMDTSWERVNEQVKKVFNDKSCTVGEIKTKWKGMRSSFTRYTHKLNEDNVVTRKYYLYETLKYLEPYIKYQKLPGKINGSEISGDDEKYDENEESLGFEIADVKTEANVSDVNVLGSGDDENEESLRFEIADIKTGANISDVKVLGQNYEFVAESDIILNHDECPTNKSKVNTADTSSEANITGVLNVLNQNYEFVAENDIILNHDKCVTKKRKLNTAIMTSENITGVLTSLEGNEDLAFFISILPDIIHFNNKEKRKLKIKILQAIDDIEERRANKK